MDRKSTATNRQPLCPASLIKTFILLASFAAFMAGYARAADGPVYSSPYDVAYSPDGKLIAVSDRTAGVLAIVDAASGDVARAVKPLTDPTGVAWAADGSRVFVAECSAGTVAEIDPQKGRVVRRIEAVGARPIGLAVAAKRSRLIVVNSATNNVSIVDLESGKESKRLDVRHRPYAVAVTPDESMAVVANLLPLAKSTDLKVSADVSLIDLEKQERVADIALPSGSTQLHGVAVSPDGRWAYAVHTLGHFTLPTTQLERGWVNTNCLSIIDLQARERYATMLLDLLTEGAADPWDVVVSGDGQALWITLAGVHQLATIRLGTLHRLLTGKEDPKEVLKDARGIPTAWEEIHEDPGNREKLVYDLAALYAADLIDRTGLPVKGPRGIDLAPDGKRLAVAAYYSGKVLLVDPATAKVETEVAPGSNAEPDLVRRGEILFHDGTHCFQHWLSCSTCHPEGRADGLNWDLLNDGIGNPKNTKSLVYSYKTPPMMSRGVREGIEAATMAGFRHIQFREPEPGEPEAVVAYLKSLEPDPSPFLLSGGELSAPAKRGKAIFESEKAACARCHPGPLYTDMKVHDVGTQHELDKAGEFDTPTLLELWRTSPYLHDGSAVTIKEVLTDLNKDDKHGGTSHLSEKEIEDLAEFLLSL